MKQIKNFVVPVWRGLGGNNMVQEGNRSSTVRSAMSSYLNLGTDLSAVTIITLKDRENCLRQLTFVFWLRFQLLILNLEKEKTWNSEK